MKSKILILSLILLGLASCEKYDKFDNNEIIENSYTGSVTVDNDSDPDGNFTGNIDSGTFAFAWVNSKEKAKVKLSIDQSSAGNIQLILNDARGKEKFNKSLTGGDNEISFEEFSEAGKTGTWKVTLIFSNFEGSGSYEIDSAD